MLQITAPQATLIVLGVGLVAGLIGWFGRGITFLLSRWWTGAPKREDAAYLHSVADLAGKLRASGMTLDEVREFEAVMRRPSVVRSAAAAEVIGEATAGTPEPDAFHSNLAMKQRAGAEYRVAEAHLEQALTDLRLLLGDDEVGALRATQARWGDYRKMLETMAGLEFKGGTIAPLAAMLAGVAETERRTAEIRTEVEGRAAR